VNDHTDHGGSTITQQLARIIVEEPRNEPSALAEVLGMMKILRYTLIVNYQLTKPEIMELYFNSVYFGKHAQGIAQAAKAYFGRDLERLGLGQCLYLTGLPQAPSIFGRDAAGPGAMQRYRHVLSTMVRNRYLSEAAADELKRERLFDPEENRAGLVAAEPGVVGGEDEVLGHALLRGVLGLNGLGGDRLEGLGGAHAGRDHARADTQDQGGDGGLQDQFGVHGVLRVLMVHRVKIGRRELSAAWRREKVTDSHFR